MGMNMILTLIVGIVMMTILGSQVGPSFIEQTRIAKVENSTISNQNLIKEAIIRFIKTNRAVPLDMQELKDSGLLKDYHDSNMFEGGYGFNISKEYGTLTISTTINDSMASSYFSNNLKHTNKPKCTEELINGICLSGNFETFYLLDDETFNLLKTYNEKYYKYLTIEYPEIFQTNSTKYDYAVLAGTPTRISFNCIASVTSNPTLYKNNLINFVNKEKPFSYSSIVTNDTLNDCINFIPSGSSNGVNQKNEFDNFLNTFVIPEI